MRQHEAPGAGVSSHCKAIPCGNCAASRRGTKHTPFAGPHGGRSHGESVGFPPVGRLVLDSGLLHFDRAVSHIFHSRCRHRRVLRRAGNRPRHDPAPSGPVASGGRSLSPRNLADGNRRHHSESRSLQRRDRLLHCAAGDGRLAVRIPCGAWHRGPVRRRISHSHCLLAARSGTAALHSRVVARKLDNGRHRDHRDYRSRRSCPADHEGSPCQRPLAASGPSGKPRTTPGTAAP